MNNEMRKYINKVRDLDQLLSEDNKWDPFKVITYLIELRVLFEGFEFSVLKFKLLFPHYEIIDDNLIKNRIDERLKVFDNIASYDIIKTEVVNQNDRILPMH